MKMNKIVVSMMAAGIMASPLAHATDGYFRIGVGVQNEAMGGARHRAAAGCHCRCE